MESESESLEYYKERMMEVFTKCTRTKDAQSEGREPRDRVMACIYMCVQILENSLGLVIFLN